MAGSSSRSSWERQQAAIRRELERQAREQARIAKEREKERLRLHLESQQKTADDMSAKVGGQIKVLDEILTSVLSHHPLPRPGSRTASGAGRGPVGA